MEKRERDLSSPEPDSCTAETSSHAPLTVPPLIITLTGPAPKITKKQNPINRYYSKKNQLTLCKTLISL